jgi:hypothetical protein
VKFTGHQPNNKHLLRARLCHFRTTWPFGIVQDVLAERRAVGFAQRKPASARGMLRPSFTGRMGDGIRQYTDKLRRRRWFRSSLWKPGRIREILTTEQY